MKKLRLSLFIYRIMKNRILTVILFSLVWNCLFAQQFSISQIKTNNEENISTQGIVTLSLPDGFFVQDFSNGNSSDHSSAIFVQTKKNETIHVGDELRLYGKVVSDGYRQVLEADSVDVVGKNKTVMTTDVRFPDDFTNWSTLEGMTLRFNQTLYVVSNYSWQRYGEVTLASHMLKAPTEGAIPGSVAYQNLVAQNNADQIVLDGTTATYPSPIPFADANNTRRTGSRVDNLTGVLTNTSHGYVIYPSSTPVFYGNERPTSVAFEGNYNLKIVSFNLEYYLADNFGTGYGPDNATESARQHRKIMHALEAMDADIYGLVEIQTGQNALRRLTDSLNAHAGYTKYAFINDGTSTNGSYTKSGYIYRVDKVSTINNLRYNDTAVKNRKKAQGFRLLENNAAFIFCLNHFKSKSGNGSGNDADQNDGQGNYNATRVQEANSVLSNIPAYQTYYGDNDVIVMGDLNAYSQEDPIRAFTAAGYTNLVQYFNADTAYSYSYRSQFGLLDHALGNASMLSQVVGVKPFHINADEPTMFEYQNSTTFVDDMYRCSDHDPIVVALNLLPPTGVEEVVEPEILLLQNGNQLTVLGGEGCQLQIYNVVGQLLLVHSVSSAEESVALPESLTKPSAVVVRLINNKNAIVRKLILH